MIYIKARAGYGAGLHLQGLIAKRRRRIIKILGKKLLGVFL
jgi:hypothetical protein